MKRLTTAVLGLSLPLYILAVSLPAVKASGPPPATKPNPTGKQNRKTISAKVPAVKGLTEASARQRLKAAGFAVNVKTKNSKARKGIVIAQRPSGIARRGSVVVITVSKGVDLVRVPNIHGMMEPDPVLRKAGLRGKRISIHGPIESDSAGIGEAYRQNPRAGALVPRGTIVTYHSWWESS